MYFDRSVLAQSIGTDASEVVSVALALPLEWSSRIFAAPEGSRAKILSSDLPQRNAQGSPGAQLKASPTSILPVSCTSNTHRNEQHQGFQEPASSKSVQGNRLPNLPKLPNLPWVLCYSLIILTSKGHQINCLKLPGTFFLLLFPLSDVISKNQWTFATLLRKMENW